jgi:uncharacterized protein (TIGR03437 family)
MTSEPRIKRRYALFFGLLTFCAVATAQVTFPSLNSSPWLGQEMLGRVESNSVTLNVVFDQNMQVYAEYGTASGVYTSTTGVQTAPAGTPLNLVLGNLEPNTQYYYRLHYAAAGSSNSTARAEHSFVTQRPRGSSFTFLLQADPHMDANSNSDVYQLTLANELTEGADFMIDVGDTMLTDKLDAAGVPVDSGASPTAAGVLTRTQLLRSYYDLTTHSLPLFLAVGNHEGEWGKYLNGTPNNMALWDTEDRTGYFPNPAPDSFFSGDTQFYDADGNVCVPGQSVTCGLGQRRSYYSWEWGDALFIMLDPFWNETPDTGTNQAGNGEDCCTQGDWSLTLGTTQYNWLKQTLENSTATYKFVFAHNLVGGYNQVVNGVAQGPMRGGVEVARYLEWGGYNLDGTWGFSTYRPQMAMPIHQLLLANHVTAFFHGHDHLYAHQTLDGITYQETPQPSASSAALGTRASDYGYAQGTLLGGRGYLRIRVTPSGVTVQYIETWLPSEQTGSQVNGMVADAYTILPPTAPTISSVAGAAGSATIAPNTWITIQGANLAPTGDARAYMAYDPGDSQPPAQLDGVSVTVNGKSAYVSYISPSQLYVLTPPDAINGTVAVQVTVHGVSSAPFSVQAQTISPSFFEYSGGSYVVATHADGAEVGPAAMYGLSSPAKPGETILVYANGFGTGALSPMPAMQIGSLSATVQSASLLPTGVWRFQVTVPSGAPNGDLPIVAAYAGFATQAGALLTVQP